MIALVFTLSLISAITIFVLALSSVLSKTFQFWPPPSKASWQYYSFWSLFRLVFVGIVSLSLLDFNGLSLMNQPLRLYAGATLALLGFSWAFYLSFYLGWKNAHGEEEGLVVKGWYAWSRNPVYLVSFLGFIGWALLVNSLYVYSLFALLIGFYILAPFLEEPWLERRYGKAYLNYKATVPRFFGIPKPKRWGTKR